MQPSTQPPRPDQAAAPTYPEPVGFLTGEAARAAVLSGNALPLAGSGTAFTGVLWHRRGTTPWLQAVTDIHPQELDQLARPRGSLAGLSLDRPRLMGVVNVTPDSFSDGGQWLDPAAAIAHGVALAAAGADIIDVGGESTRPGAHAVDPGDEQARVLPVITALAERGLLVSIDTRHPATMAAAAAAGAQIINDVTALAAPGAPAMAASLGLPVVLMHMQGAPETMQAAPRYHDVVLDVADQLAARLAAVIAAGVARERILLDPGIGFGKTVDHNTSLLRHLALLHGFGLPLVVGVSRKSMIQHIVGGDLPTSARLPGSLAAALAAVAAGAQILRVHDVAQTQQALAVSAAIRGR